MTPVRLPVFEGPIDVLLAMVERRELDATSFALVELTRQYLIILRTAGVDDLNQLADAIAIVARLMLLKSQALLPKPERARTDEDTILSPEALAELAEEYRRFKEAALAFRAREDEGLRSFPRPVQPPMSPLPTPTGLGNVTLDRLMAVVQAALARRPVDRPEDIPRHTVTVKERLSALEVALLRDGRVSFNQFIGESRSRMEIVVGFMAVLELLKSGAAIAEQPEPFGDIIILREPPVG